ncbi:hypothetical protein QQ045_001825 [Rhodiola kirilowii]
MASGSSGRVNSPSQGFDFGSDDVLCTYDDFNGQEGINGTNHTDSVMKADFDLGLFLVSELERKEEREEKFFNGEEEREIKKLPRPKIAFRFPPLHLPARQHASKDGKPAVVLTTSEIHPGVQMLQHSLIAKFSAGRPSIDVIRRCFSESWFLADDSTIGALDARHILIILTSEDESNRILAHSLRKVGQSLFRLFRWTPDFHRRKEPTTTTTWVKLPGLPSQLFDQGYISSIVSTFGRFIAIDEKTRMFSNFIFARACIEHDLSKPIPGEVMPENEIVGDGAWVEKLRSHYYRKALREAWRDGSGGLEAVTHRNAYECTIRASFAHRNPALVVMMAKMNEELKEIRAKSTEQIHEEVVDELRMLKLQRSSWNEFKSSEFHRMRKRDLMSVTCLSKVFIHFSKEEYSPLMLLDNWVQVDALVSSGLAKLGYQYVNLDKIQRKVVKSKEEASRKWIGTSKSTSGIGTSSWHWLWWKWIQILL